MKMDVTLKNLWEKNVEFKSFMAAVPLYAMKTRKNLKEKILISLWGSPNSQSYSVRMQEDIANFLKLSTDDRGRADGTNPRGRKIEIKYAKISNDRAQIKQLRQDATVLVTFNEDTEIEESTFTTKKKLNSLINFYFIPKSEVRLLYKAGVNSHGVGERNSDEKHVGVPLDYLQQFKVSERKLKELVATL